MKETYKKIKQNAYNFPEHCQISENAKNLINKILQLEPSKRPNLDEILEHPYINKDLNILKTNLVQGINMPPCKEYVQTMKQQMSHMSKNNPGAQNTQRNAEANSHKQQSQPKNIQGSPKSGEQKPQGNYYSLTARDLKPNTLQSQLQSNQLAQQLNGNNNIGAASQQLLTESRSI